MFYSLILKTLKLIFFGEDVSFNQVKVEWVFEHEFHEISSEIDYDGNIKKSAFGFAKGLLRVFSK